MFSIEHPALFSLFILLLLPVVIFGIYRKWRADAVRRLGNEKNLSVLLTNFDFRPYRRTFILLLIALGCLVLAVVNFRKSDTEKSDWVKGLDIIIALDVSKSMLATDEQPNRLEKSKIFAEQVLSKLSNDQVGLILFAGKAYIQTPLTNDYNMVKMLMRNGNPASVSYAGTDLADPIYWSNELFDKESFKYKVLLLITDGEDHNEAAMKMAADAKEKGIVIISVGIGSPEGAQLITGHNNEPILDENGQIVVSRLNEELLKGIAGETGGTYVHLKNISQASDKVVSAINTMEKRDVEVQGIKNYRSYFSAFAVIALMLIAFEHYNPVSRKITKE